MQNQLKWIGPCFVPVEEYFGEKRQEAPNNLFLKSERKAFIQ